MDLKLHAVWHGPEQPKYSFIESWREMNPGATIKVWRAEDIKRILTAEQIDFCNRAKWILQQVSVFRTAIIIAQGGIYGDHDCRCIAPLDEFAAEELIVANGQGPRRTPSPVDTVIGGRADHPFWHMHMRNILTAPTELEDSRQAIASGGTIRLRKAYREYEPKISLSPILKNFHHHVSQQWRGQPAVPI